MTQNYTNEERNRAAIPACWCLKEIVQSWTIHVLHASEGQRHNKKAQWQCCIMPPGGVPDLPTTQQDSSFRNLSIPR